MPDENSAEIEKRKESVLKFLKEKKDWFVYLILAFITFVGVWIRTLNIDGLKDITTNSWTLGPDLDPFLFLRWAKYIVEHGSLMTMDLMRYVPLGYDTAGEMKLLSYMIVWFYKAISFFSKNIDITYASIIFPVFMFGLTTIAFFLFAREIFYKEKSLIKNLIALFATAFFVVVPSLISRTIAGIPEKESAAFFFIFMAFYFFMKSYRSEKLRNSLIFAGISGAFTAGMALVWGGVDYLFLSIGITFLLAFILGKVKTREIGIYSLWIIFSFALMAPFSTRYSPSNLVQSFSTGFSIAILFVTGISIFLMKYDKTKKILEKIKIPREISSLVFSGIILVIFASIILGPMFIINQFDKTFHALIQPQVTRWGLTVAESRQPYFAGEWTSSFGPVVFNIPLFFWLFFIGSIVLFGYLIEKLTKKEKFLLIAGYTIFLFGLIFSRYDPNSILNGENIFSLIVYFGGVLLFAYLAGSVYYKRYKENNFEIFSEFNFGYLLYFAILVLGIIGSRSAVRLIMVLAAVSPVVIAFFVVKSCEKIFKTNQEEMKMLMWLVAIILVVASLFTLWNYYQVSKASSEAFVPSIYQWQWQKAMQWVRENTPENTVFAHWWDYGYWLQSIGERATILDGGNIVEYWNHLMGRYVLTGTEKDDKETLEFLYTHNATHLLIDSSEIGKYTAFSSIGADENYDRFSWITNFLMDSSQTYETNNQTVYVYTGGTYVDEDIVWEQDGKNIFLPKRNAVVGAVLLKQDKQGKFLQPEAVFFYNNQQYRIPMKYVSFNGKIFDFGSGLDAGIFLYPKVESLSGTNAQINPIGALIYLSKRTVHSNIASYYLFDKQSDYFKLVHTEEDMIVQNMKSQNPELGSFVYYDGLRGPIKIFSINYPTWVKMNETYLSKEVPNPEVTVIKPGEYN